MSIAQANRQLRIKTLLGSDVLLLYQLQARESLGRLFKYQVELLSKDEAIHLDVLLGKKVDIELGVTRGGIRFFNAFVSRFSQIGVQRAKDVVERWSLSKLVQPGCYVHTDYDFEKTR
ncbi:MAG: contractile injection system protein, VgrG/Pvc8 family [Candidatus Thiodiazotropha sp.]